MTDSSSTRTSALITADYSRSAVFASSEADSATLVWPLSVGEERVNQATHGAGFVLSLIGSGVLMANAAQSGFLSHFIGSAVYCLTLVALYGASTLSHSFTDRPRRNRYRTLDQVCIFLLVAGNYTPFGVVWCADGPWKHILLLIWVVAAIGCYLKLYVTRLKNVSIWFYVVAGWLPVLTAPHVASRLPSAAVTWILAGACCYTCGLGFLMRDRQFRYFHAAWHLLVIAGSACHYIVILRYTIGVVA